MDHTDPMDPDRGSTGQPPTGQPPTGQQVTINHGDQQVTTVSVAAGLRSYSAAGRDLVDGYPSDQVPRGGRGQTLLPWPNRIADGRYRLGGDQQLALTEPSAGNAIHGLARWVRWRLESAVADEVTWQHVVVPQPGWPTSLDCRVTYRLAVDGLTVITTADNVGAAPCYYGTGSHPYLTAGTPTVDDARLEMPAATWFETDARGVPTGRHPVAGTEHDLRAPQLIGRRVIDHAFGDLARGDGGGGDGRWVVRLTDPHGRGVELWADRSYDYVQVFSGDTLPPGQARRGLAVEPMTCPPNAFNDIDPGAVGVVVLEPGDQHVATWGIRRIEPL
jgi:aldose 1-epimerase